MFCYCTRTSGSELVKEGQLVVVFSRLGVTVGLSTAAQYAHSTCCAVLCCAVRHCPVSG